MMTVYQRKNGKWYCYGTIKGERYHVLCDGATDKPSAIELEDGVRYKIRQKQLGLAKEDENKKCYTVNFMCKKYLEYSKANKATYDKDVTHTEFFKEFFGKNKNILDIKPIDVENMKIHLKNRKTKRGCLTNSTVNRYYSSLKKAYNVMIENNYIDYNPCNKVDKFVEDNTRNVVLPLQKQIDFLKHLPTNQHRVIVLSFLNTGQRKNNILRLRKIQINIEERHIEIIRSLNKGRKHLIIPLNDLMMEIIMPYYEKAEDYLFINPKTNKPFTTIIKAVKNAGKAVGIENLVIHDLRRTFGTRLKDKNVSLRVIQELLGHSSVATTQRYLKVDVEDKREALQKLIS